MPRASPLQLVNRDEPMDSALADLFFRQLFARSACRRHQHLYRELSYLPTRGRLLRTSHGHTGRRQLHVPARVQFSQSSHSKTWRRQAGGIYSQLKKNAEKPQAPQGLFSELKRTAERDITANADSWLPRTNVAPDELAEELASYDLTTAEELRRKSRRPKRRKMLMRDFIEDSLYNPTYGYFSSQAVIFNPGDPFDFPSMTSEAAFNRLLDNRYRTFEDDLDTKQLNETRQLWHTPTELFRPHYAESMARYLVENYKISLNPYHDLIIYELGAGNGTFMMNVLDYIRDTDPEVYARTRYKIVEISTALATLQQERLRGTARSKGHADKVEVINRSIFSWDTYVPSPCFIVALEVIDNFGHDVIRYDRRTEEPLQSLALIDTKGEFYEAWTADLDPIASRFLRVRDAACERPFPHPLKQKRARFLRRVFQRHQSELSGPEYIPTRLMQFFDVLQAYFPAHRLLCSDFHSLPDSVPGVNAPVVQTRFQRRTIPVSTPLVRQGYFDIFFPTDFAVMEDMYRAITGKLTRVVSHEEFMRRWAYVEDTTTKNGENPLLSWYQNASVLTTV